MKGELISAGKREAEKAFMLQDAVARQIAPGEVILHQQDDGKEHIAVTDRRVVITKVGKWLGERSESIPLGAITGLSTHTDEGKVILLQIAVCGYGSFRFEDRCRKFGAAEGKQSCDVVA